MEKSMYRVVYKRHPRKGDDSFITEGMLCERDDLFRLCDYVLTRYPEVLEGDNYMKITEVVDR